METGKRQVNWVLPALVLACVGIWALVIFLILRAFPA